MVDVLAVIAIGLPAVALATLALFLINARSRMAILRTRPALGVILGILVILAGALLAMLGLTVPDNGLLTLGWVAVGAGIAISSLAGTLLFQRYEVELKEREASAAEAALGRSQLAAIARAAEATGIGLLLVERTEGGVDRVKFCNKPAAALIGEAEAALVGQALESLLVSEEREGLKRLTSRGMEHPGEPLSAGFTLAPRTPGADRVPVELGLTCQSAEGRASLAVTLIDARAKRSAIAAAREARSDADFYLDLVTHDLSNFNQGALGYLELIELNKDAPAEKVRRFEASALRQIRNSARLIENVKLLSVIRDSREPLAPVDALYALHDAIDHVVFSWTEKDVEVRLVPMTGAHLVRADGWLRDLFSHLLDNAVKFSAERRVEVAVSVAEGAGGKSLVFRFADRGRGISPEEREVILDRLASRKRDYSAFRSGIGLFIVKTISDRYGGRLWIEERVPGEHAKGSVFCLELPCE